MESVISDYTVVVYLFQNKFISFLTSDRTPYLMWNLRFSEQWRIMPWCSGLHPSHGLGC